MWHPDLYSTQRPTSLCISGPNSRLFRHVLPQKMFIPPSYLVIDCTKTHFNHTTQQLSSIPVLFGNLVQPTELLFKNHTSTHWLCCRSSKCTHSPGITALKLNEYRASCESNILTLQEEYSVHSFMDDFLPQYHTVRLLHTSVWLRFP